jgi:hypothetical protein
MNRKYSAVAVAGLALGAAGIAAADASAREAPEPNYPRVEARMPTSPTDPRVPTEASGDDTGVEVLQAGASALGGAGLAIGGMWLYRRRHAPAI